MQSRPKLSPTTLWVKGETLISISSKERVCNSFVYCSSLKVASAAAAPPFSTISAKLSSVHEKRALHNTIFHFQKAGLGSKKACYLRNIYDVTLCNPMPLIFHPHSSALLLSQPKSQCGIFWFDTSSGSPDVKSQKCCTVLSDLMEENSGCHLAKRLLKGPHTQSLIQGAFYKDFHRQGYLIFHSQ